MVGPIGALWAAGLGLALLVVPILVLWIASSDGTTDWLEPLRTAGLTWVAGHDVALRVGRATYSLLPWGSLLVWLAILAGAGSWAARSARVASLRDTAWLTLSAASCYALVLAWVSSLTVEPGARTAPTRAFGVGLFVAFIGFGWGALRGSGLLPVMKRRMPTDLRTMLAAALAGALALFGFGAIAAAVSLGMAFDRAVAIQHYLDAGVAGGFALLLLGVGYAPVAAMWSVSYVVGAGISIGPGATLSPFGTAPAEIALPPFPLVAGLPQVVGPSAWALPALGVAAGIVIGLVVGRRGPRSALSRLGIAVGASCIAAIWLAIAARMSFGSLGDVRLVGIGPRSESVALLSGGLLLLGAIPISMIVRPRRSTTIAPDLDDDVLFDREDADV